MGFIVIYVSHDWTKLFPLYWNDSSVGGQLFNTSVGVGVDGKVKNGVSFSAVT